MRGTLLIGLAATLLLAGCESRFNPVNWFGGGEDTLPVTAAQAPPPIPQDPRPSVDQVSELTIDRVSGGILVTAIGVPATQGWFEAALVAVQRNTDGAPVAENGALAFRMVAVPPQGPAVVGSERSQEISAGLFLSDQTLEGVRTIVVRGQRNERAARR